MVYRLCCPCCRQFLYAPISDAEDYDLLCTGCKSKFKAVYGEIAAFTSSLELDSCSRGSIRESPYRRVYNLRLRTGTTRPRIFHFGVSVRLKTFHAQVSDPVIVLCALRRYQECQPLLIFNCISLEDLQVYKPNKAAFYSGVIASLFSFIVAVALAAPMLKLPLKWVLVGALPPSVLIGAVARNFSSLQERNSQTLKRLSANQELFQSQAEIEDRIQELAQDLATSQKTIYRMRLLWHKMLNAGADLYTSRAETIGKGIAVMEKQLGLTQNLIDGYRQIATILEIEYETTQLTDAMPEDLSATIVSRMAELEAIAQKREELALLVDPAKLLTKPDYLR